MTNTADFKVKFYRSLRKNNSIILLSFGFFLLFILQNFLIISISDYLSGVGVQTGKIVSISYGLFNIIGLFVVDFIGYKWSLIIGGTLMIPFFISGIFAKLIVGDRITNELEDKIRLFMYPTGILDGIGQSILWIAQGCYISGVSDEETVSWAYGVFNLLFNLTGLVGSGIMWIFGSDGGFAGGITDRKDLITLIVLACISSFGIIMFIFLTPLKSPSSQQQQQQQELSIVGEKEGKKTISLTKTLIRLIPTMPAMAFMGVFLAFVGVGMIRPYSNANEKIRYLSMMNNGLFTVIGSVICTAYLNTNRLPFFIIACLVFHAISFVLYGIDVEFSQNDARKHVIVQVSCATLGLANSIFITCIYTLISLRYQWCISIAMWIFMCINGIIGGLLTLELNCFEWALMLTVLAIPSYVGMLGEYYRMNRDKEQDSK